MVCICDVEKVPRTYRFYLLESRSTCVLNTRSSASLEPVHLIRSFLVSAEIITGPKFVGGFFPDTRGIQNQKIWIHISRNYNLWIAEFIIIIIFSFFRSSIS